MSEKKLTGFVVSHTHWDRAWYWPFEWFRVRLVQTIDQLLEILENDSDYQAFVLDGQTVVLEDYLEVKPENKERLKKLVKSGRLHVGPWYILPDEFLVSGEALVRNLQMGMAIAEEFGATMREGYVPDPFGHIAQLPQILKKSGLRSFIFSRGMGKEIEKLGTDFFWEGPDGSRILSINQRDIYGNLACWGFEYDFGDYRFSEPDEEVALQNLQKTLNNLKPLAQTPAILLNNGIDHLPPQPQTPKLIKACNKVQSDIELRHGTFADFIDEVEKHSGNLKTHSGELIGNYHHPILLSVYSARIYLKQANYACQNLLERYAEPLALLCRLYNGADYSAFIQNAWKTLLKNHPHDDICGCSVDEVHRENVTLFEKVQQIGRYVCEQAVLDAFRSDMNGDPEARTLFLFNPLNWDNTDLAECELLLPSSLSQADISKWHIMDENGDVLPHQVISDEALYRMEVLSEARYRRVKVLLAARSVPSCGWRMLSVAPLKEKAGLPHSTLRHGEDRIENAFFKVQLAKDGTLTITDKRNGQVYEDCNLFEDCEDAGDEYTYSWVEKGKRLLLRQKPDKIDFPVVGPLAVTMRLTYAWLLPQKLHTKRARRSQANVGCRLQTEITLYHNQPRIDFKTHFDNKAEDHRLRVLFPAGFKASKAYADGHFGTIERPAHFDKRPDAKNRFEYYGTRHNNAYVYINKKEKGLLLANRGLPEYEIIHQKENSAIALTLLRCVGILSRNDYITRVAQAGPQLATPEAQCPGSHTFEYSLVPFAKNMQPEQAHRVAYEYAVPLYSQTLTGAPGRQLPATPVIAFDRPEIQISALKSGKKRKQFVVRVYNRSSKNLLVSARTRRALSKVSKADLLENETGKLALEHKHLFAFTAGPASIETLLITLR